MYQFAVFQFSSPPKNIGSTRAEEIFCRKEFFHKQRWFEVEVQDMSADCPSNRPFTVHDISFGIQFFFLGRWIRQNYGCYVLREHAKLLTFKWAVKEEKNIPNKFRSLSFHRIDSSFHLLDQQEAQLEVFESPLIGTEVILTRSQQV